MEPFSPTEPTEPTPSPPPVRPPDLARAARRRTVREMTWTCMGLFFYMLSFQLLGLGLFRLVALVRPQLLSIYWFVQLLSAFCMYGVGPLVLLLFLRRVSTRDIPGRVQDDMHPGRMSLYCIAGYGLALGGNIITLALTYLLTSQGGQINDALEQSLESADSLPMLGLVLVLVAPVAEEFVFRHLLLRRLRKYGDLFCMLATAFAFSLFHANLPQMIYAFTLGILLAHVVLRHGHLIYSILIHAFVNFLGFVVVGLQRRGNESAMMLFALLAMLAGLAGLIFVLLALCKVFPIRLTRSPLPVSAGFKWTVYLLNPGMLLFEALTVFLIWWINFS